MKSTPRPAPRRPYSRLGRSLSGLGRLLVVLACALPAAPRAAAAPPPPPDRNEIVDHLLGAGTSRQSFDTIKNRVWELGSRHKRYEAAKTAVAVLHDTNPSIIELLPKLDRTHAPVTDEDRHEIAFYKSTLSISLLLSIPPRSREYEIFFDQRRSAYVLAEKLRVRPSMGETFLETEETPPAAPLLPTDVRAQIIEAEAALAAGLREGLPRLRAFLRKPVPEAALSTTATEWLPYWTTRAFAALATDNPRAGWQAAQRLERITASSKAIQWVGKTTLDALGKRGWWVETERDLLHALWGGRWSLDVKHDAPAFTDRDGDRYTHFSDQLRIGLEVDPGAEPGSFVLRASVFHAPLRGGIRARQTNHFQQGETRNLFVTTTPFRVTDRPRDIREPITLRAGPAASLGGGEHIHTTLGGSVPKKERTTPVTIRELSFSPDFLILRVQLDSADG
jgi:hypothetical protein